MSEKYSAPGPTVIAPYLDAVSSIFHPIAHPLINTSNKFAAWKENFGLVQPGTVEALTREISRAYLRQLTWREKGILIKNGGEGADWI